MEEHGGTLNHPSIKECLKKKKECFTDHRKNLKINKIAHSYNGIFANKKKLSTDPYYMDKL